VDDREGRRRRGVVLAAIAGVLLVASLVTNEWSRRSVNDRVAKTRAALELRLPSVNLRATAVDVHNQVQSMFPTVGAMEIGTDHLSLVVEESALWQSRCVHAALGADRQVSITVGDGGC
jgi:hypothetical protein